MQAFILNFLNHLKAKYFLAICFSWMALTVAAQTKPLVLKSSSFKHYVDAFNKMEDENIKQAIPNDSAFTWMQSNIPLFECPAQNFEEMFYFRWWTLRKHIKKQNKDLPSQNF